MKNIIKKSVIFALGFCSTTMIFIVGYATWINLSTVTTGDTLTSTRWNNLINAVNNIGTRIDGIGQDGSNVGIGTASPSQKLSVYGTIESTSGGFKFPDGTVQTSAINNLSGIITGGGFDRDDTSTCTSWGDASCVSMNPTCPSGTTLRQSGAGYGSSFYWLCIKN